MILSPGVRWIVGFVLVFAALTVLRFRPWETAESMSRPANGAEREKLVIGFLPVT